MRRGYKAWCEEVSADYHNQLGLNIDDPLDPFELAKHINLKVWHPKDIPNLSKQCLEQLTINDIDNWSAVTIKVNGINLTILNSSHPDTRQRSSLAHEISHIVLNHKPSRVDLSEQGYLLLNTFNQDQEDEADWLSASLLVPREGLLKKYKRQQNTKSLARHFGVSEKLLNWRLRMTGILIQSRRSNRYMNK